MGFYKRELERRMMEGWRSVGEKYACTQCFPDYAIRRFIKENTASTECSYCTRSSSKQIGAHMDDVLGFMAEGLHREYDYPDDHLPYDSSEGGWQLVTPQDSYDLLSDLGFGECPNNLFRDLTSAFSDRLWVQKNPLSLSPSDALRFTWDSFCEQIKHRTRFVFYQTKSSPGAMDELGHTEPYEILETIGKLIRNFRCFSTLPKGSMIVRARQHEITLAPKTAAELGPPKREKASQSRMSPAGIAMFYGADSEQTAFVETFDSSATKKTLITFGNFRVNRSLRLLDLTKVPSIPSLFDDRRYDKRMSLIFLCRFIHDAVKAVVRDGSEHFEYVPTQVVAEFFRHVFTLRGGRSLDGIKFQSSRKGGKDCFSLFFNADDCCDPPAKPDKPLCLEHHLTLPINFRTGTF